MATTVKARVVYPPIDNNTIEQTDYTETTVSDYAGRPLWTMRGPTVEAVNALQNAKVVALRH